ncbi:hypothetical protein LTR50_002800 [Elasticomyces elasticus]|nr:hypothetical protein LTR50_002800 [Elasticomyces elasticus]
MRPSTSLLLATAIASVTACPDHSNYQSHPHLAPRQTITSNPGRNATDWAYEASYNWGRIKPAYELCQTGTQQSPIAIGNNIGLSNYHHPNFTGYGDGNVTGNFFNWGYGPAFTLKHSGDDWTDLPSMQFDDETVYLKGWHIHAPADHSVGGRHSKAELHMVHVTAEGHERAVIGIRIDPGSSDSEFFAQLPQPLIGFNDTTQDVGVTVDMRAALAEVNDLSEFWTYKGSLTSPPCREGIRWFVARSVLFVGVEQMRDVLRVCTYSARAEQEVWRHEINSA